MKQPLRASSIPAQLSKVALLVESGAGEAARYEWAAIAECKP
jgi:hypothetical protein